MSGADIHVCMHTYIRQRTVTLKVLFVADAGAALTRLNLPCDMEEEEDESKERRGRRAPGHGLPWLIGSFWDVRPNLVLDRDL